jgi:hypothetical protein
MQYTQCNNISNIGQAPLRHEFIIIQVFAAANLAKKATCPRHPRVAARVRATWVTKVLYP